MKHRLLIVTVAALAIALGTATPAHAWDKVGNFTVSGNIGGGTESPAMRFHLYNNSISSTRFRFENSEGIAEIQTDNNKLGFRTGTGTTYERMTLDASGNLGIGTASPTQRLHLLMASTASSRFRLENSEGFTDFEANDNTCRIRLNDDIKFELNANNRLWLKGELSATVVEIRGGSDLSEMFEVSAANLESVRPGMVTCIDPEDPGKLQVSTEAYARTVAGIISGAGDLRPGMTMGQDGSIADGKHPVALTGRVYCYVDATKNPVVPGDLLTTSDTPGHAMKATDYARAQGAIIGKAMTGLKEGKGLVLVLVSLQ
jgi:hypothetical protein